MVKYQYSNRFVAMLGILSVGMLTVSGCSSSMGQPGSTPVTSAAQQGLERALNIPILKVIQPGGARCTGVKINSGGAGAPWWATLNCNNGFAYLLKAAPATILLALPAGTTHEKVYDVDRNGFSVGVAFTAAGAQQPTLWNPAGGVVAGALLGGNCPNVGLGAGIEEFGWPAGPVVGQTALAAPQACWWKPGAAFLIPPAAPAPSIAYDVNIGTTYVGQLGTRAAEGTKPGPLVPIPGVGAPSILYAINNGGLAVGYEALPPAAPCNALHNDAIEWNGVLVHVPYLPLDCRARLLDVNEVASAVGFGFHPPGPQHAMGFNLAAPYPGGPFDLSTVKAGLGEAEGIADNNFIIATDIGVGQVYVLR